MSYYLQEKLKLFSSLKLAKVHDGEPRALQGSDGSPTLEVPSTSQKS